MSELLDLYDGDGRPTGCVVPRGQPLSSGQHYLCVHVWIRNSSGEFLIQRRSLQKDLWPGLWAATGGVVLAGEDSLQAAYRETYEELGLRLPSRPILLERIKRKDFFTDLWLAHADGDTGRLKLQAEEVCDARWETTVGIRAMVERGEFVAYHYLDSLLSRGDTVLGDSVSVEHT